jgi:GH43 family beta-xylosidase
MKRLSGYPIYLVLACLALISMSASGQRSQTFTNPLLLSGADPHMTTFEGRYYLTYTTGSDIRIRKAESLKALDEAEEQVIWTDDDLDRCCNVWAPEIHRLKGPRGWRWYVYYTAGPPDCCAKQRMHVLESRTDNPVGPYMYKGRLFDPEHDFWAIDPTVFSARDGSRYVVWSGTPRDNMPHEKPQYLYIAKLINPWTLQGPRVEIGRPDRAWEMLGGAVNEGPAILQRGGKTFLTYSGSGCWTDDYAVGMLVATEGESFLELASWRELPKPLLTRNDEAEAFGPGHNSFFKSPDGSEDWIIYHANPSAGLGCASLRSPRAQKVEWGRDGLPHFGAPVAPTTPLPLPSGDPG